MNTTVTNIPVTNPAPKFRENAVTAVTRDAQGITIHVKGVSEAIRLEFAKLSAPVREEAMGYGMEVRLTRAAAIERDTKSGAAASPQTKFDAIRRLAEHYNSGTEAWAMSGQGPGLGQDARTLAEALVRAIGLDLDVAIEQVKALSSAERDALRVDEEIKPHLDSIYAERARASAGTTKGLLAKLREAKSDKVAQAE